MIPWNEDAARELTPAEVTGILSQNRGSVEAAASTNKIVATIPGTKRFMPGIKTWRLIPWRLRWQFTFLMARYNVNCRHGYTDSDPSLISQRQELAVQFMMCLFILDAGTAHNISLRSG